METKIRSCESEALLKKRDLWKAIEDFDLDGDAPLPFTRKLARDNIWSAEFAARVADEYKKFVFLAMESGHPVAPSDAVDQAWHLHLCYTRSYWDDLCGQVFGRPLHHGPTRGGAEESAKFADWYARTLDSYRAEFGEPPADIWPPASESRARKTQFRRVDAASHWIVPKPSLGLRFSARGEIPFAPRAAVASAMLLLCAVLLIGGDAQQVLGQSANGLNIFDWDGASFLALFWTLCLLGAIAVAMARRSLAAPHDARFPTGEPDPYLIARLSDEGHLATDAALASMQQARKIDILRNGRISRLDGVAPAHPWEREVWNVIASAQTVASVRYKARAGFSVLDARLCKIGLLVPPALAARAQSISLAVALALLLVGLAKVAVGASRGKPVGFLVLTCLALAAALMWLASQKIRLSERGVAYLKYLRQQHKHHEVRTQAATSSDMLVLSMALWGYNELDALGMAEARAALRPVPSSSFSSSDGGSFSSYDGGSSSSCGDSSSSCGSGDSGGSGCGGCGGGGD